VRPDPYAWTTHPEATASLALLVGAYAWALRRYPAEPWRVRCFLLGALLLLATAVTPLDSLSYHVLIAHLLQNVILAEWAPALLVLAIPAALAAALARVRPVRLLTRPVVALPLWLATYFLWHLPPAYDAALEHAVLLHVEHVSYLAAGFLFWWPVLQDVPWRLPAGARAGYVFAAFVLAAPLGLLLLLLRTAVYSYYADAPGLWGMSALTDQQLAGIAMTGEQALVFFVVFGILFFRWLRDEEDRGAALDRMAPPRSLE
jgi:cytochrome c oxidase assembly factor CtaG